MPRILGKLVRNGNATAVTIPRPLLFATGWLPGESVVLELLEDRTVRARRPEARDFGIQSPPRLIFDQPAEAKP